MYTKASETINSNETHLKFLHLNFLNLFDHETVLGEGGEL